MDENELEIDLDDFSFPIANEENKKLEVVNQQKTKKISHLEGQIEETSGRIQAIAEHLKNVRQELQCTQGLLEARRNDIKSEEHMKHLAEREEGRLKEELKRIELEREELKERMNTYENTVFRTNRHLEELKKNMKWDHQRLEAWLEESARKDEDVTILSKYSRADESKVKELTLKIEQLHENRAKMRRHLEFEVTETLTAQIELDKTAEAYRQLHEEREQLIKQWEETVEQMRKRDEDIEKNTSEMVRLKADIRAKEELIREKQEFLAHEQENNKEVEKKLATSERESSKLRLQYQDTEASLQQLKDELETLKYSVDRTATDLESSRAQSKQYSKEIRDKRKNLETLQHQRELLQNEVQKSINKMLTAEERAHQMDLLLAQEEEKIKSLERELENLRDSQFKKNQELFELKRKQTNMQAEIQGGRASLKNLNSKQRNLDEQSLKQQELLYTQDFQLQQLQHKLNRMEGERTEDETTQLNAKIKELEGEWDKQHHSEQLLRTQLKRVQDDLRRVNRRLEKGGKEKDTLREKIDEINLHIDSTERELKKVISTKQNLMVDENIMKLEVKRLRETLFSHADGILSLEKRKHQLETAMSERTQEIAVHREMQKAQIKACESERQTVSGELYERISKIDKLRKRFEILTVSMCPPDGEQEYSQAYYVIKAAQKREELQRTGDDLDARIRKAEKEIRALENTLMLMNAKNEAHRKSLNKLDQSGEEIEQLEKMDHQLQALQGKHRHKKKQLKQVQEDLGAMSKTLETLESDKANLSTEADDKKTKIASTKRELQEYKAKHERAERQASKVVAELRVKQATTGPLDIEEDIQLRQMKEFNTFMIERFGKLAAANPDMASTVQLLFSQSGLPPPPSPGASRAGSVPSTARSSHSQISARSSSMSASTPVKTFPTKTVDVGEFVLSGSLASTPRSGVSSRSSVSSTGSKKAVSRTASQQSSRPPSSGSQASSRVSSRRTSRASSVTGTGKTATGLDLSIGSSRSTPKTS